MGEKWPSINVRKLVSVMEKNGWIVKRQKGSRRRFSKAGYEDYTVAYHDSIDIPPHSLKRMAIALGLTIENFMSKKPHADGK